MSDSIGDRRLPTVMLIGVRGFGSVHLANIRRLEARGRLRPVALVDPLLRSELAAAARADPTSTKPASDTDTIRFDDLPLFASFADALLEVGVPDVVVVAAPIPAHADIAAEVLRAGADLLLEKPPFARLDDFHALLALQAETGRRIQVGFQSLGSAALADIAADAWNIGPIVHVRAMGAWVRPRRYWARSSWAGRRSLHGRDVTDGAVTNPFAHAVATALSIAGVHAVDDVASVVVDAYRTNPIDGDDTTALVVRARRAAPTVSAAFTLSAAVTEAHVEGDDPPPVIEIVGAHGTVRFRYTEDEVVDAAGSVHRTGRTDLLENLLDHREHGSPLLVPLEATGAFMRVLEAMRLAPEPTRIEERFITMHGDGVEAHPVLHEVEHWIRAAADVDGTFVDAGAPWASARRDAELAAIRAGEAARPVAALVDGVGTSSSSSPRPFLFPIRTFGGVDLAARRPADHDWHLGLAVAYADVNGVNFWGGNTFVPGLGYRMLDDHGRMDVTELHADEGAITASINWVGADGSLVLVERRSARADQLAEDVWMLTAHSALSTASLNPVRLGGPGPNGRVGAGYGGWFWRMPSCEDIVVRTSEAVGESAVHGTVAPWLSWSARFTATQDTTGEATVVFLPGDGSEADPWFVRAAEYPAVGLAPTWDRARAVEPGDSFDRGLIAVIADGRRDPAELVELIPGVTRERVQESVRDGYRGATPL
ncbi:DUF6807 family protein [Curtobacterium ammoniigenes]|uniref:DUF6807 family protein n=1 Tax=Curtobacterium ammoniigenes TaxID=395387 RepID=UPI00082B0844|nr:DUF6807 family protein [Curtobacterium ammoniigenes]